MSDKHLRILVADDQPYMRQTVRALLESERNWEVCGEASDGQEAIERTQELSPDVVVMDLSMPRLNGFEATRQIRESFPRSQVLILTNHDFPGLLRAALDVGARGCVLKNDSERLLIPAVESVGRSKAFFSSEKQEL